MKLESMYQEIILDHYRDPHGRGLREGFQAESHQVNPTCGDEVTLRVHLDGDIVRDVSYEGMGCSISQASESVLHDLVVGQTLERAERIAADFGTLLKSKGDQEVADSLEDTLEDAVAFVGVGRYPSRIKCALLGWAAFRDATLRARAADTLGEETA
ncbi:MAG: SUF system NifU family Fe-S cluster assembly protein [Geodermatophilaceae bacterium]|nr:SUF system NifU family Fe-S cluster assembly protein [Geodermatophilaceae bacterium]